MSACSGRNYNFRCINVVFWRVLRESARTAAKSRTNLSTHSGKAIKGLGRLAPNLAHMCRFISEWIYAKQIAPRDTRGHMGGFRGSKNQNLGKLSNGWTDWQVWRSCQTAGPIGTKFGTHVQIHPGMDIRQTNCPPRHKGALGGFTGSNIQKSWQAVKRLDRFHQLWFTSADSSGNGHRLNTSRPSLP